MHHARGACRRLAGWYSHRIASHLNFEWIEWLALSGTALSGLALLRRRKVARWLFGCLMTATLGATRWELAAAQSSNNDLEPYNDTRQRLIVTGVIDRHPEQLDRSVRLTLRLQSMQLQGAAGSMPAGSRLLVYAPPSVDWRYGDWIEASGRLHSPPSFETFDYRQALARAGIASVMPAAQVRLIDHGGGSAILRLTESLRRRAQVVLRSPLPEPESALLEGILPGDENSIQDDLRRDFNATGTTHIIAISGFNITIIATLAIAGFGGWLGARRGLLAAALAIAGYTLLVGADPSVVRAAFMAGFGLAARRFGRQSHAVASLAGTAGIMTAINPQALWDIGFPHSFAATLGLILYAAPLQHLFERLAAPVLGSERAHRFAGPAGEYLLFMLAAQVMTLPLTLFYFQRFSLTALVANPLILPLQPAVMILGGLVTAGGLIWSPMGRILKTSPGCQLP
jgi:competence protein ComEC